MSPVEQNDSRQDHPAPAEGPGPDSSASIPGPAEPGRVDRSGHGSGRFPAGQKRHGAWAGRVGTVLAAALVSAVLSGAAMYAAIIVTRPAPMPASTGRPAGAQLISLTQSDAIVRVAAAVQPSVVTITAAGVTGVTPFSMPASGAGSGFVVTANGLILTNNHVIAGASSLTVTLDDTRRVPASVVASDPVHDLALIKVSVVGLTPVTLGDSGSVRVGQLAIAIGSALGTLTDSVTQGIVSGVDRTVTVGDHTSGTDRNLSGLIQTDAAVNPGNSGGPLLDANGSVVGVITASVGSAQGVGFAVPIDQAKALISTATK